MKCTNLMWKSEMLNKSIEIEISGYFDKNEGALEQFEKFIQSRGSWQNTRDNLRDFTRTEHGCFNGNVPLQFSSRRRNVGHLTTYCKSINICGDFILAIWTPENLAGI